MPSPAISETLISELKSHMDGNVNRSKSTSFANCNALTLVKTTAIAYMRKSVKKELEGFC